MGLAHIAIAAPATVLSAYCMARQSLARQENEVFWATEAGLHTSTAKKQRKVMERGGNRSRLKQKVEILRQVLGQREAKGNHIEWKV